MNPDQPDPQPNETERRLARDLRMRLEHDIAAHLAAVREGLTLEGPRVVVSGHAELPRYVFLGPDRERALELATDHAWRSWFGELRRRNLRPCGWPTEQRTHLAMPNALEGWVEVDEDRADRLMISVSCEAVPMT